eukprot:GHVL01010573.1.p1 GENE.GHVL01010573.1~~GHVL01010573.1.p1  ORF type:complete len:213 (+),score=18.01 GHVL01010573.1:133-771(+)
MKNNEIDEPLGKVKCFGCISLSAAVICIAFWQIGLAAHSLVEALKTLTSTTRWNMYFLLTLVSFALSSLSACFGLFRLFKQRFLITWIYALTLFSCDVIWVIILWNILKSEQFTILKIQRVIMIFPILFCNTFFTFAAVQYLFVQRKEFKRMTRRHSRRSSASSRRRRRESKNTFGLLSSTNFDDETNFVSSAPSITESSYGVLFSREVTSV